MKDPFSTFCAALPVLAALACSGCDSENGLSSETLSFQSLETGSTAPKVSRCTVLPQLIGSEVDEDIPVDADVFAHVVAMRDDVVLSFSGTEGASADGRLLTDAQLAAGYDEKFSVTSSKTGATFDVALSSRCP